MRDLKLFLAATIAALLCLAPAAAASPFEVQGWRTPDDHIHTTFDAPMFGTLSAAQAMPVTTLLHNRGGGTLTFVRWSDGSNVKQSVPLSVPGTGEPEQTVVTDLTLDPAQFDASGWRELRVTSNFVTSDGRREFTTTRVCVDVENGKGRSDYCGGPTVAGRCGGGAWYDDTDYRIVFVDCRDVQRALTDTFAPGDQIRVKFQDGPGYANLDPHFHAGDAGMVLAADVAANTWTTITVPAVAAGPHKLHLRAQGSATNPEAGAYVLPITVG